MGVRVGPFERTSDAIQATLGTHGRGAIPISTAFQHSTVSVPIFARSRIELRGG